MHFKIICSALYVVVGNKTIITGGTFYLKYRTERLRNPVESWKKWDAIITHWNQFLELEPNHAKAYLERGDSYYHKGDLKSALLDDRKACDLGEQEACEKYQSLKARVP